MTSFKNHVPLAIITIVLSVAIFILFKELKTVKAQAATGAQFAASFQEQQQQHAQLLQQLPQQFIVEPPPQLEELGGQGQDATETKDGDITTAADEPPKPKAAKAVQKRQQ